MAEREGLLKRIGKGFDRYVGGLLGEDLSQMTPEERAIARRQAIGAIGQGMVNPANAQPAMANVMQARAMQREQRQLKEREAAAQEQAARISGRLFGEDLSSRIITPQEAVKMGNAKLAGSIRPRQQIAGPAEVDTGELTGVTPTAQYVADPRGALRAAMTPAGIDALKVNPLLSSVIGDYIKPKELDLSEKQKLYAQAVSQGYEGTIMDFLKAIESSKATQVNLTTGERGQNKAQDVLAGAEATMLAEAEKVARSAKRAWTGAQTLIDISSKPGAVGGALAPGMIGANDFLVSLFGKGVAREAFADAQKFRAAVSQLFIEQMGALGGARGLSQGESEIVYNSLPRLDTDPLARIEIARLVQKKSAENINDYNESYNNFREAFRDIRTGLKPIQLPRANTAPPAGTRPAPPL